MTRVPEPPPREWVSDREYVIHTSRSAMRLGVLLGKWNRRRVYLHPDERHAHWWILDRLARRLRASKMEALADALSKEHVADGRQWLVDNYDKDHHDLSSALDALCDAWRIIDGLLGTAKGRRV